MEPTEVKRICLITTAHTYRANAFIAAADKLGIEVVRVLDMPDALAGEGQTALGVNFTTTTADNNFGTVDSRGNVGFLELSSGFSLNKRADANRLARLFVRYSANDDSSVNRDFGINSQRDSATITSGLTLSMH